MYRAKGALAAQFALVTSGAEVGANFWLTTCTFCADDILILIVKYMR